MALPLCGNNAISFSQIEIFIRNKKKIRSKIINIEDINKLPLFIKNKVSQDIKKITSKRDFFRKKKSHINGNFEYDSR